MVIFQKTEVQTVILRQSGIYDRKEIEEHLQRVGQFDPVTRTKLI